MPASVEVSLPSDLEIVVARRFDAPRSLIWDWHTRPELLRRWLLGPDGWTMPVCEIDLRVGGSYRYRWRNAASGQEFGAAGEHREIDAPTRVVTIERMDGFSGESLNRLELTDVDAGTRLEVTMRFPSTQVRDGALQVGMTGGMAQSYDRLEELLAAEGRHGGSAREQV